MTVQAVVESKTSGSLAPAAGGRHLQPVVFVVREACNGVLRVIRDRAAVGPDSQGRVVSREAPRVASLIGSGFNDVAAAIVPVAGHAPGAIDAKDQLAASVIDLIAIEVLAVARNATALRPDAQGGAIDRAAVEIGVSVGGGELAAAVVLIFGHTPDAGDGESEAPGGVVDAVASGLLQAPRSCPVFPFCFGRWFS